MATKTKTFYPSAHDSSVSVYDDISGATNPIGKGSGDDSSYAQIYLVTGVNAETYIFWPFDTSAIPDTAEIISVECNMTGKISSPSGIWSITAQLYSGDVAKGEAADIPSVITGTFSIPAGTWTRDELKNCRLRLYAQRGVMFVNQSHNIQFCGADLTVTYTYQNEKFMIKLGGTWNGASRVFKKVSGIWVEQTDLANVIEENVRFQNGGEYVSPYKVTITGSGKDSTGYFHSGVDIGGISYDSATTIEVEPGTVAVIQTYQHSIYLDGVLVAGTTSSTGATVMFPTYEHTVTSDCSINLVNNDVGTVTITTE